MRTSRIVAVFLSIALSAGAASAVVVETYTGSETYLVSLPGSPDGGGGLDFNVQMQITSLDFTPGAVTFEGQPVDFDGTEADFLAPSYSGTCNLPATGGPAVVDPTYDCNAAGAALTATGSGQATGLSLGPAFSDSNLDIDLSQFSSITTIPSWNSTSVPELNGASVTFSAGHQPTAVDAVSGILDMQSSGDIQASQVVPTLSTWGMFLLTLGLITAGLAFRRRASRSI